VTDDPHIRSFRSFDEMIEYMAEATNAANANLLPEQRALTWGSYWFRPYEDIIIFGYVFTEAELAERERYSYHNGGPLDEEEEAEFTWTIARTKENHERGYLFGEAWSVWEPHGELGDTHRASAWPISREQFEFARAAGWNHLDPSVRVWLEPLWHSIEQRG
jgi:hypothetical protein